MPRPEDEARQGNRYYYNEHSVYIYTVEELFVSRRMGHNYKYVLSLGLYTLSVAEIEMVCA